ncbi:MAG: hypothetical protein K8S00_14215 [Bacteroidales bacterium]|nr:hypothetical protein [Bacteroidales bacterium]
MVKIADEAMGEVEDTERDAEKTDETKKVIPQIFSSLSLYYISLIEP